MHIFMHDGYPSFHVFDLQKMILCPNGRNSEGSSGEGTSILLKTSAHRFTESFLGQQMNVRGRGDDTAKDTHHWPRANICQNRNQ